MLLISGKKPTFNQMCLMPDVLPRAPKKSFPKKGKPGLLAKTIMRKSGCILITFALPFASVGSRGTERTICLLL